MKTPSRSNRRPAAGFTLIEVLIAVVLLSLSLAAMVTLWSVSRRITERSRDSAEYYAIARQEAERFRVLGYQSVFNESRTSTAAPYTYINPATSANTWPAQYYDEKGVWLGTTAVVGTYYRVTSTFSYSGTAGGTGIQRVGVQKIEVYTVANAVTPVYDTRMLFTAGGI
ncbi:MAG: type II secretion system protein [Armatimonadota bacterium]